MSRSSSRAHTERALGIVLGLMTLAAVSCGDDAASGMLPTNTAGTSAAGAMAAAGATAGAAGATTGAAAGTSGSAAGGTAGSSTSSGSAGSGDAGSGSAGMGTGTAGSSSGSAGSSAAGSGAAGSAAPDGPVTFAMVYQMIWAGTGRCLFCHGMAPTDGTNGNLGMIMSADAFYEKMVMKPAAGSMCMGMGMYIVPGMPEESLLLTKLKEPPPCGMKMPIGGSLTDAEIMVLEKWIKDGAKKD